MVRAGGRYRLAVDGVVCLETRELMVARSEVLRRLVLAAHPGRAWLAVLHAAGVAGPDGAVLLCGSSGAGKSTLTGLLLASGLALVTDDYAPLEVGTRALWPVPFGLSVKDGSWPLLEPHFPDLSRTAVIRTRARRQRYLRPPSFATTPQRVRSLVFPLYAARRHRSRWFGSSRARPWRSAPGAEAGTKARRERLRELADWIGTTPAYAMSYGDGADAVTAVRRLLGL